MKHLCVYCGSNAGAKPAYKEAARQLGCILANEGITLVYGGGSVGLMGELADTVLNSGGNVIGVIPELLERKEVAHRGLSELKVVDTMHERKAAMADLADGFIALPGGLGTIEELFEMLTWSQLGYHTKPCGLLNIEGYYDHLVRFLDHMQEEAFVKAVHREMLIVGSDPQTLLSDLGDHQPTLVGKWMDR